MSGWRIVAITLTLAVFVSLPLGHYNPADMWIDWLNRWAKRGPRLALVLALIYTAVTILLAVSALELNQPGFFIFALIGAAIVFGYLFQVERAKKYVATVQQQRTTAGNKDSAHITPANLVNRITATMSDSEWKHLSAETIAWMRGENPVPSDGSLPPAD